MASASATPAQAQVPEPVRPAAPAYQLRVDWPRDVAPGITVTPTLTLRGATVKETVRWTLRTYQVVNGRVVYPRVIDVKTTRQGTATLRTQPPYTGEVGGYFLVVARTSSATITAKARYSCGSPGSCTLRKVYPVRVQAR